MNSMWSASHTPLHLVHAVLLLIGLIAITIWLTKTDKKTLLQIAIVALVLAVLGGFFLTGSWGNRSMKSGMSDDMGNMMQMMGGAGGMMSSISEDEHNAHHPEEAAALSPEETAGKTIWDKLEAKEITCADITDADYQVLGEYFMGQMAGTAHEMMNQRIVAMHGAETEENMHAQMGKLLSGCSTTEATAQ